MNSWLGYFLGLLLEIRSWTATFFFPGCLFLSLLLTVWYQGCGFNSFFPCCVNNRFQVFALFSHSIIYVSMATNQHRNFECFHILPFSAVVDVHLMATAIFSIHTTAENVCEHIVVMPHMAPISFQWPMLRRSSYCLVFGSSFTFFHPTIWRIQFSGSMMLRLSPNQKGCSVCDVIMMWRMLENDAWFCFMQKQYKMSMVS